MRTIAILGLLTLALGAQQQSQPTFKSGVQVVEVDVRVFDGNGGFVRDLKAEDFELLENGAPQKIEALYFVEPAAGARAWPSRGPLPRGGRRG